MMILRISICFFFILLSNERGANSEEYSSGAEYLKSAIRDIVEINSERDNNILSLFGNQARIVDPPAKKSRGAPPGSLFIDGNRRFSGGEHQMQQQPSVHHHTYQRDFFEPEPSAQAQTQAKASHVASGIPDPPSLTKGELAALYEAAVSAGHSVQMNVPANPGGLPDQIPVQAALHEIQDSAAQQSDGESYYYYYYPLKSFMDHVPRTAHVPKDHYKTPIVTSYNTHLHNVKVESSHPEHKGIKAMEPLFMAISGFVGMAMMFLFSTVLLPRLTGGLKKVIKGNKAVGGGKGTNVVNSRPNKTKITIISRTNDNKNNNNNKNRNNKNNQNNLKNNRNKNNNNNNRKKPRFLDGYVDWRYLISNFDDIYGCTSCKDHAELEPYNGIVDRNGAARFWN